MFYKKLTLAALALSLSFACAKPPEAEKVEVSEKMESAPVAVAGTSVPMNLESSKLTWVGTKVTGHHTGTVQLKSGEMIVNEGKVVGGKFVADMSTITVQDLEGSWKAKLEKHLRTEDFFLANEHPESTFEITAITGEGDQLQVKGNMTIRGITKGISFPAKIVMKDGKPASADANFNFNRKEWGIVYPGKVDDAISDEVNLDLKLRF